MLNGQLPRKPPKVAVVLIGTNDLYAVSECTNESETDLVASVKDIRSRCSPLCLNRCSTCSSGVFICPTTYKNLHCSEDSLQLREKALDAFNRQNGLGCDQS